MRGNARSIILLLSIVLILGIDDWTFNQTQEKLSPGLQSDRVRRKLRIDEYLLCFRSHVLQPCKIDINEYSNSSIMLIVVNFHYQKYSASPFLEKKFFPRFARRYKYDFDVLCVGPVIDDIFRIYPNHLPEGGYYSYHSLTVAYNYLVNTNGLKYSGYFLMNDDSCLSPDVLNGYDHNKNMMESVSPWSPSLNWHWNRMFNEEGIPFADTIQSAISQLERQQVRNGNCSLSKKRIYYGWSDFYYVRSADMEFYLKAESIMFDKRVFLETAVPTLLSCSDVLVVSDCNHGMSNSKTPYAHSHPHKYYREEARKTCLAMVDLVITA